MKPVSVAGVLPATDQPTPRYQVAFVKDATGRTWVVRAPLDAAGGAELERNDELIRLLGRHLPFKVPAAAGYADLGAAGRAAVYPYVEGSALSFRHLPDGPGLTSAVGRALAAVHNIQRELFEEAGTPVFDASAYRARRLAELDRAAETGHVPTGLLTRWEQALEATPLWQFSTTATHGSLDGGSFLVAFAEDDAATGRVVALTGWENAQVADPADDFAALVKQASPSVVDAVFDSYAIARSQRPDGFLIHRARLASELQLVAGLARAVDADDTAVIRERAEKLRKLDRLTAVDDSLVPRTALITTPPPQSTVDTDPVVETAGAASAQVIPVGSPAAAEAGPQATTEATAEPAADATVGAEATETDATTEGAAATETDATPEDAEATNAQGPATEAVEPDPDVTAPVPSPGGVDADAPSRGRADEDDRLSGGVVEVSDRSGSWQTVQARRAGGADSAAEGTDPGTDHDRSTGAVDQQEPDDGQAEDATEEIPAPALPGPEGGSPGEPHSGEDGVEAAGSAAEEERLHTLYGMPTDLEDEAVDGEEPQAVDEDEAQAATHQGDEGQEDIVDPPDEDAEAERA